MPSDEYASASAGGALRIKGAKIKKHKKKKTGKSDLEKNLSTGGEPSSSRRKDNTDEESTRRAQEEDSAAAAAAANDKSDNDDYDEQRRPSASASASESFKSRKTETERKFEEARRKKLLELAEEANARPELLKTHKERVEELNTYLSKLSEHHDMPKIGPG